jgi:hypothetical protein
MLTLRAINPTRAIASFCETPPLTGLTSEQFQAFCQRRGLLAFAAEEDGILAGFAIAESQPGGVHVLSLEGDKKACHLLLERLVQLAGERDMTVWCPTTHDYVLDLLEGRGFVRRRQDDFQGRPSFLYHKEANERETV